MTPGEGVGEPIQFYGDLLPNLRAAAAQLANTRPLMAVMAGTLAKTLRDYWRGRDQTPSERFASAIQTGTISDKVAEVVVGGPAGPILIHKIRGGTVKPKTAKALSIPVSPEARRTGSASLWQGPQKLALIPRPGGNPILVTRRPWVVHYVLMKSVYHAPDPAALPSPFEVTPRLRAALVQYMDRVRRRGRA